MTARKGLPSFEYFKRIDWKLLVFLMLFLNVKLVIKALALLILFLLQKDLRFGFALKNSRLPLFYPIILLTGLFNFVLYANFSHSSEWLALLTGAAGWIACLLAIHQMKLFTEKLDPDVIEATLIAFFLVNAIVSLASLGMIIIETGAINPYRFQGGYQKYFMGTGDYIRGLSFDTSTTNAILNAAGIIYFLYRKNVGMVLLCGLILLLTASNLTNLALWLVLIFLFIFHSTREQKSLISILTFLLVIFLAKISPQNNHYLSEQWGKITGINKSKANDAAQKEKGIIDLTPEEKRKKIAMDYLDSENRLILAKKQLAEPAMLLGLESSTRPELPADNIHSPAFQNRDDTDAARKRLLVFMQQEQLHPDLRPQMPGKLIALQQTGSYFRQHPAQLITGKGMGHFSSKLAFRTTCLGMAGGYPSRFQFIDPDFRNNHLSLYAWYFSQRARMHSITNLPNSVYDQLLSEYGLSGLLAFFLFYLGFFLKQKKQLTYGLPLIFLLAIFCFSEYWFEQLSIIPFFELLLFLDLKRIKNGKT